VIPAKRMSTPGGRPFPRFLCELVIDLFGVVEYWEPSLTGPARGRLFEGLLYRYCDHRGLTLSERAGSRSLRCERSASGFQHESDAVITTPECTVHLELKHLSQELGKNELMVFNQKGLDFLLADSPAVRRIPLHRVVVSGGPLTPSARRFALLWGIHIVEPERLPLLLLHQLARRAAATGVTSEEAQEICREVPALLVSLQDRLLRFASHLGTDGEIIARYRADRVLNKLQRISGDLYWMNQDEQDPGWLENRYEALVQVLGIE
jgi:hypothetical protein